MHVKPIFKLLRNRWYSSDESWNLKQKKMKNNLITNEIFIWLKIYVNTFIDRAIVFKIIVRNIAYSKPGELTNHQILYWITFFGMYRFIGRAFNANSMHFRLKNEHSMKIFLMTHRPHDMSSVQTWFLSRSQSLYSFSPSFWNVTITKPTKMFTMKNAITTM